jgi:DNA-directed RNA polymerase subunit RPC12/RpoP
MSRFDEHYAWNRKIIDDNASLKLACPICGAKHTETLTKDPSEPDCYHHVHQCTRCGIRFDLFVRTRSAYST